MSNRSSFHVQLQQSSVMGDDHVTKTLRFVCTFVSQINLHYCFVVVLFG